jgi:dethiobiotin synthetase
MLIVFVTGTGTGIGKTFVSAAAARAIRARGGRVVARKPVQSFAVDDTQTDAAVLAAATGEEPQAVCPAHRWLAEPMAPPMAAEALGLPAFTIADLAHELVAPPDALVIVEGAGGVRSPLASDGDNVDYADAVPVSLVVLVADAGLGTINLVRLSVDALRAHEVVVFLNHFDANDQLHARNRDWLQAHLPIDVLTEIDALVSVLLAIA